MSSITIPRKRYEKMMELLKENQELKKKQLAQTQVNVFLMKKFKDIITEQSLAEMVGLGKDTGTEIAMVHIAEEFLKSVKT